MPRPATGERLSRPLERNPLTRPVLLLRGEGLALLFASVGAYLALGGHWGYLLLGFLADATLGGYLLGPRVGAALYNVAHSTLIPLGLIALGWSGSQPLLALVGLVMLAHIGLDRAAGYGLKYPDAFKHTHLGS